MSENTKFGKYDTLGEFRVRSAYDPTNSTTLQHIKERGAEFINYIDENVKIPEVLDPSLHGEFFRIKSLALTAIEEATMWAVKATTLSDHI